MPVTERKWPHGRRLADFMELSGAEATLVEACRSGVAAVFAETLPPAGARTEEIRAELIRFLVLGGDDGSPVHEHGVELKGAVVAGSLNLNDAEAVRPLRLLSCRVPQLNARSASLRTVDFSGSTVTDGIDLSGARCSGSIYFGSGFVSHGTIRLRGVNLSGDLDCGAAQIDGGTGSAISADGIAVAGSVFLNNDFVAKGEVGFVDCDIEGSFECSGGRFENRSGNALTLDRAVIAGTLFLDAGFRATGCVRLYGARLGSNLRLTGARLKARGFALACDGATIRGSVKMSDGFTAVGEVGLVGVEIGGTLECSAARFRNSGGIALALDRTTVAGSAYLGPGFFAVGAVSLAGATIRSNLSCTGGRLRASGDKVMRASGCTVQGSIFMRGGFHASGEVVLIGSRIGGTLECDGGVFENSGGNALTLDRLRVSGSTFFNRPFLAVGRVSLAGALIESNFSCVGASISSAGDTALNCSGAAVTGQLHLQRLESIVGEIDLSGMHVGTLCDDETLADAREMQLVLDGFAYTRLGQDAPCSALSREAWLAKQRPEHLTSSFRPQPWEEMGSTLRAMGHSGEARRLALFKHKWMRSAGRFVGGSRIWDWVYGSLVGYGYRPWRLVSVMAAVWAACTLVYWPAANPQLFGFETHLIAPKKASTAAAAPGTWPRYEDLFLPAYSAEVMLPIASLGYEAEWHPVVSSPDGRTLPWGWLVAAIYWSEIVFGWLASLLLVAAVGNLIKKD